MIQPLRRVHRYVFATLAIVLSLVLTAALMLREDAAVQREWPFESAAERRR